MLDRVKGVKSFKDHLIFVRYDYIPNFRPPVPSLHVKKFVVGGWVGGWVGVKSWILVLSFRAKTWTKD